MYRLAVRSSQVPLFAVPVFLLSTLDDWVIVALQMEDKDHSVLGGGLVDPVVYKVTKKRLVKSSTRYHVRDRYAFGDR